MLDEVLSDAKRRMERSVEATRHEFATVRTGRASTSLLDRIQVEAYGSKMPLSQLATLSAPEARLLSITPFDMSTLKEIERAIQESDLGLNPSNDGRVIRLPIPQLTEERRREFVKVVRALAEEGKIAVRNVRRDALHQLKEAEREGDSGSDDTRRGEDRVQKLTDEHIAAIENAAKTKEAEILEV